MVGLAVAHGEEGLAQGMPHSGVILQEKDIPTQGEEICHLRVQKQDQMDILYKCNTVQGQAE